jgi:hypothetical protein
VIERRAFLQLSAAAATEAVLPGSSTAPRPGSPDADPAALRASLLEIAAARGSGGLPDSLTLARLAVRLRQTLGLEPTRYALHLSSALSLAFALRLSGQDPPPILRQAQALLSEEKRQRPGLIAAIRDRARRTAQLLAGPHP